MIRFRVQIAVGLAAVTIAGCSVVAARSVSTTPASTSIASTGVAPIRPANYFLTVATTPEVTRADGPLKVDLVRRAVETLQLRSVRNGRVVATLLHSLGTVDATMTSSGTVIAVADYGCRSQILRIDPRTKRIELIRTLPQSASDIALNPDGEQLAYVTYPASDRQPCVSAAQPKAPLREEATNLGGPAAQFLPNVLSIVSLTTGVRVQTATSNQGNPLVGPAWSRNGASIAVTTAATNAISLVSATHPDLASARQLRPRRGCGYVTAAWTVTGIIAVQGCGPEGPDLSPRSLVRLSATGQVTASWRLPGCIDGVSVFADPAGRHVLVQSDIGYGNGLPCGYPRPGGTSIRIAVLGPAALSTIAVFPQDSSEPRTTGW